MIYLKSKVSLSSQIIEKIEGTGRNRYILNLQAPEEAMLDTNNYSDVEHKCPNCLESKDENSFCDNKRHENKCLHLAVYNYLCQNYAHI